MIRAISLFFALLLWASLAFAQTASSSYTVHNRYDAARQLVGTIASDPDGAGVLKFPATRMTYDSLGRVIREETGELASWQAANVLPSSWAGFTVYLTTETSYDAWGRPTLTYTKNGSARVTLTQTSYDAFGRVQCVATRMNAATFNSPPSSACTLGTSGTFGPDRIERTDYDDFGRVVTVKKAMGTPLQQTYQTYTYTAFHAVDTVADAKGNKTKYEYDTFRRSYRTYFPSKTAAGSWNIADYEQYGYDLSSNRTSLRKRDAQTITYVYDALNRVSRKDVPNGAGDRDVWYAYDNRGLELSARFDSSSGQGIINTYDGFGRLTATDNTLISGALVSSGYDANGNRTVLTYPDGQVFNYAYDQSNRLIQITQGASNWIIQGSYDGGQRLKQVSYRDRATSNYTYDPVSRLQSLAVDMAAGTTNDLTNTLAYNPSSQVTSSTLSNSSYLYSGVGGIKGGYTVNGLNQYTAAGGASLTYDANGNLTSDGSTAFAYDIENRLKSASGAKTATLKYDPYGRLYEVVGASTTRFVYDGDAMIAERSGSNALLRRYVHGRGMDRPLTWYEGAGVTNADRRDLVPDRQGSVIAVVSATGVTKNTYDEYGVPGTGNAGVFSYTGQRIIPELGLYYYKARIYDPYLGRFLQTDPVGYEDQMNLYAYVGNDPVNATDPTGEVGKLISAGIKLVKHRGNPNKAGKEFVEDIAEAGAELLDGDLTLADAEAVFNLASPLSTKEIGDGASGVRKAVDNSRAKRRAAREAQRNADPSVPTSRSGRNTSDGRGGPRGQIKEGSDGRPAGVADGTRDRNNSPDHPAGMEAGRLKPSEPTGKYNQPRLQNSGKGKAKIDDQ